MIAETPAEHERAKDRRLNLLLIGSFVTMTAVIVFALIAIPKILSNESATNAVSRGNNVTSCRASYRVDVDDASSALQEARARLDVKTSEGLAAAVTRDEATLAAVLEGSKIARDDVVKATLGLRSTTAEYRARIKLSRDDPEKFLEACRRELG